MVLVFFVAVALKYFTGFFIGALSAVVNEHAGMLSRLDDVLT